MKKGFYPRLALSGIAKNRKIYVPYILTCVGMVMMFYIVSFLSSNKSVAAMPGGSSMQMILGFGCGVIGFFSLIFLFYTNSFLIRKRKKEFGLYNILGMGKWNLARILVWESVFITVVSLAGGLFCGILFSKIAELLMAHILGGKAGFTFTVGIDSIIMALILFAAIFFLILLNTLRQIHVSNPIELLHSGEVGEKPPKSNWFLALLGLLVLAGAYYIALSVKEPIAAFLWFFVAVIMVILATYLLFIAGSVVLCKLLQKNKHYYYKTGHFVSVSSMVYRMKRNGAGLASICILSTMVLVMLSTTACLYIGAEGSLRSRYPRNIEVDTCSADQKYLKAIDTAVGNTLKKDGAQQKNITRYRYLDMIGYAKGNQVVIDQSKLKPSELANYSNFRQLIFIPLEDYNKLAGASENLADGEVMIYCTKLEYTDSTIVIQGLQTMKIKKLLPKFIDSGIDATQVYPTMFVVVRDLGPINTFCNQQLKDDGKNSSGIHSYYGFDLSCDNNTQIATAHSIADAVQQLHAGGSFPKVSIDSVAQNRAQFYALYGGLFFLGVLLGIVFILGAVLIMYYKQITEGYEDQARFDIMQKVGMTKREIRKSINSQVLTVFFLPLVTAGVHVAFAFPMISKLMAVFNLTNIPLLIIVTIACYLIFAVFYIFVYVLTSRAYYGIVSSRDEP